MGLSVCLCLVEDGGSCVWLEAWGLVRGGEERETSFRQGDDGEKAEVDDVMKVLGLWYDGDGNGIQLQVDVYKWVVGFITKRWAEKEGVVYTGLVRWWSGQ